MRRGADRRGLRECGRSSCVLCRTYAGIAPGATRSPHPRLRRSPSANLRSPKEGEGLLGRGSGAAGAKVTLAVSALAPTCDLANYGHDGSDLGLARLDAYLGEDGHECGAEGFEVGG